MNRFDPNELNQPLSAMTAFSRQFGIPVNELEEMDINAFLELLHFHGLVISSQMGLKEYTMITSGACAMIESICRLLRNQSPRSSEILESSRSSLLSVIKELMDRLHVEIDIRYETGEHSNN
jgi:hypothetical protein